MPQCSAFTLKGKRCKNKSKNKKCVRHSKKGGNPNSRYRRPNNYNTKVECPNYQGVCKNKIDLWNTSCSINNGIPKNLKIRNLSGQCADARSTNRDCRKRNRMSTDQGHEHAIKKMNRLYSHCDSVLQIQNKPRPIRKRKTPTPVRIKRSPKTGKFIPPHLRKKKSSPKKSVKKSPAKKSAKKSPPKKRGKYVPPHLRNKKRKTPTPYKRTPGRTPGKQYKRRLGGSIKKN